MFNKKNRQHGVTLLESLIAIVLTALGVIGMIGIQLRTLADTQNTVRREQAIRLIEDLGERLKISPNALRNLNSYASNFADMPTANNCSAGCDAAAQATNDVAIWKQLVRSALPLGQASIFIAPGESNVQAGSRRQLGVMLAWRENEHSGLSSSDKLQTDATQVRDANGTLSAGAGTDQANNACPDGYTCHLQYVPVSARCAPYTFTSPVRYFCPGA
ncbi:type IV pilus modification protein PilV [Comamonas odontotermitis]|uniref:type IV pilus modification protein PilV n=1 Tax=Comamonas odontotermitis TaxID=379895 RepID=UPI00366D637B